MRGAKLSSSDQSLGWSLFSPWMDEDRTGLEGVTKLEGKTEQNEQNSQTFSSADGLLAVLIFFI